MKKCDENGLPGLDPMHRMIFRSIFLEGAAAEDHFRRWIDSVDFDAIDYTSYRMVPMLFERFSHLREENPYHGRMKGIRQYFLYKNTLTVKALADYAAALNRAGITPLLFKGAACMLEYYPNPSLRPLGDADVLVERKNIGKAAGILEGLGFIPKYDTHMRRKIRHSVDYINGSNLAIDLHISTLHSDLRRGADRALIKRASERSFEGSAVRLPSPEDIFLTSCVSGIREIAGNYTIQNTQWLMDCKLIIEKEQALDWRFIVCEANRRKTGLDLFIALKLLSEVDERLVPAFVFDELEDAGNLCKALIVERYRTLGVNPFKPSAFDIRLKWTLHTYRDDHNIAVMLATFPAFIIRNFRLDHYYQIPSFVIKNVWRRLGGRSAGRAEK